MQNIIFFKINLFIEQHDQFITLQLNSENLTNSLFEK